MEWVEPQVYLIGGPIIEDGPLDEYLGEIGASGWTAFGGGPRMLVEVMGRLCYRSFKPGLNPNVSKIRGSAEYIENIIHQRHGSVLEHVNFSFILHNVSRVLTHELVRHRVGVAISQESLRYVRLEELRAYLPKCFREDDRYRKIMERYFEVAEETQKSLAELADMDGLPFERKKELTSAFRRMAPMGLATTIGWTANARTLRHVISLRTAPSAEEEIRFLFTKVYNTLQEAGYGVFFCDANVHSNGHIEIPSI